MTDRLERVAQAIGTAIWGAEVVPTGGWIRAARAALAAADAWNDGDNHAPKPHNIYRVFDPATQRLFDATPCYGSHEPWWVPRNGFTGEESNPIPLIGTYWQPLPAPPENSK